MGTQLRTLVCHFSDFVNFLNGKEAFEIGVGFKATIVGLDTIFVFVVVAILINEVVEISIGVVGVVVHNHAIEGGVNHLLSGPLVMVEVHC